MPMKEYKPDQVVNVLRQIEVGVANGKTTPQACLKQGEIYTFDYTVSQLKNVSLYAA